MWVEIPGKGVECRSKFLGVSGVCGGLKTGGKRYISGSVEPSLHHAGGVTYI